ncbi:fimbria/pilus outer membrane usher protein [Paraburkholderia terrae]
MQLTVNQTLKDRGAVFANVSSQHYWNRPGRDMFYQLGYSNGFKYGTYSVTAGRTRSADGTLSNEVMLSTSIPLGHTQHSPMLSTNLNAGKGASSMQTSLGGAAGERNQYSYNVYDTVGQASSGGVNASAGASGTWRAPVAQVTASASGGAHSAQVSAGVSGSVVAHPGGVTFSQTVGDTFGLVEAKGAEGATVSSASGVKVDSRGYAVVPFLTAYGMNTVDIDPKGSSSDVEFVSTSERVAPRLGSVAMLRFKTNTGRAALVRAPRMDGEALPFGAEVVDGSGRQVGVVAQDSRIFARGVEETGTLTVKWGESPEQQCSVRYSLPAKGAAMNTAFASVESHCVGKLAVAGATSAGNDVASVN